MRNYAKRRSGFDRVLIAVAATFLSVSGTAAFAQADNAARSPADLAIDAAIPMPEPANVPPPTIDDFKQDAAATPAVEPSKDSAVPESSAVTTATAPATAPPATEAAKEPVKDMTASIAANPEQPVADKLREALGAKAARYFDRKGERAAVEKFYAGRDYAPIWTQSGAATASAKAVMARLKDAAADGLDAADYPVPDFATSTTPEALAEAELKLTASVLDYARQAQSGRIHWSQVASDALYPEHPTDPAEVLANVSSAKDASAALNSYNPPHKPYQELKAKLAELRGQADGPLLQIAEGATLKFTPARKKQPAIEMNDPRVPQLRAKLGLPDQADTRYDAKLAEAVRKFQRSVDLAATGVLDDRTIKALNSPKRDRQIDLVIINMERLRWLPRQLGAAALGDAYVMLNVPDYSLKVMHNGAPVWTTRVVAGKPGKHATPMLTETMKYITVNPTWNVPPSIIYNEYLPALQQDPTVLQRMGLKLSRNRDGSIHISQPPGESNALGRIRFNFPNKFLVYQHDTPDKHLFAKEERAFSHGCMRVQNPDQYAATLLGIVLPKERYTPERIRSMYGRSEVDIKFPTHVPVHITYQTAFVDDGGKLQIRKDIYGRDATMLTALRNSKGRNLENVVAHAQPSYARPRAETRQGVAYNDGGVGGGGPSFFERLFGGANPPPQERRRRVYSR